MDVIAVDMASIFLVEDLEQIVDMVFGISHIHCLLEQTHELFEVYSGVIMDLSEVPDSL